MKKTTLFILCLLFTLSLLKAQEVKVNTNMVVEADGTVRLDGAATVWDDMLVYPDATKNGGSRAPTWTKFIDDGGTSQGVFVWMFSTGAEQEVYFCAQIPHGYKVGSSIYPHVHWTTATGTPAASGGGPFITDVVWGLEYSWSSIGNTFGNTTVLTTNAIVAGVGSVSGTKQHLISSFGSISGSMGISSILICRLFRKTGDANDTFPNSVGLLFVDFHYEKDTEGSRQEFIK